MSFDISNLALEATTFLQLKHPVSEEPLTVKDADGVDQPVGIELYGQASKQYRTAVQAMQNRALKRSASGKKSNLTAEEMQAESIGLLVACSAKAVNLNNGGEELDNAEAFRKFYADARFLWVKDQVDTALGEVANFLKE